MKYIILLLATVSLAACAHKGHGHCQGCGKKSWEKMDANKDGKVIKDEFLKHKSEMWDAMDSDKDGNVTVEESMAHKKAMKKENCKKCSG